MALGTGDSCTAPGGALGAKGTPGPPTGWAAASPRDIPCHAGAACVHAVLAGARRPCCCFPHSKLVASSPQSCRIYKNYDPRAKIIRQVAEEVFAIAGGWAGVWGWLRVGAG